MSVPSVNAQVERAPEPSDIVWENLARTRWVRAQRAKTAGVVLLVSLATWAARLLLQLVAEVCNVLIDATGAPALADAKKPYIIESIIESIIHSYTHPFIESIVESIDVVSRPLRLSDCVADSVEPCASTPRPRPVSYTHLTLPTKA